MKKNTALRVVPSLMLATTLVLSNGITVDAAHGHNNGSSHSSKVESEEKSYSIPDKKDANYKTIADVKKLDLNDKTVIIMTNDTHGAIDGFAYIPSLESVLADRGAEVLTVDCGDFSQSRTSKDYVKKSSGISAIKIMNAAGYDVAALGNHEFDYEYDNSKCNLSDRLAYADFPILCANAIIDSTNEPLVQDNYVYQTNNGMNIGFFGLDTGETQESGHDSSGKTDGLTFLTGTTTVSKNGDDDYTIYDCALDQVKDLKNADNRQDNPTADIVICLAHLGIEDSSKRDAANDRSYEVLRNVNTEDNTDNRIDLLLDANSHDIMTTDSDNNSIISTGYIFQNIGVIVIDNDSHTVDERFLIKEEEFTKLTPDENVLKVIEAAKDKKFDDLDEKHYSADQDDEDTAESEELETEDETTVDDEEQITDEQTTVEETVDEENTEEQSTSEETVDETPEDSTDDGDDSDKDDHHHHDHHHHH